MQSFLTVMVFKYWDRFPRKIVVCVLEYNHNLTGHGPVYVL